MKKIKLFWLLPIAAILILLIPVGCSKEKPPYTPIVIPPPPPPPPSNPYTPPMVWVNSNKHIAYPMNSFTAKAYQSRNHGSLALQWKKIAGPAGFRIDDPKSLETKITNLEVGDYQFEIQATDSEGKTQRDTLSVYVIKPGPTETIIKELEWMCPMGCNLSMDNIYSFIPKGVPIRVWIRPAGSTSWEEVKHKSQWTADGIYFYDLYNSVIEIYTDNGFGFADLRIQY
ncbi:hypothetical protein HRH25_23210 [Flavisolibacter sp. BT320]|nr:hypothetical protein [Flavisolibacter longurius]